MMGLPTATDVRDLVITLSRLLRSGVPNVLMLGGVAALVTAAYIQWGRVGGLMVGGTFAILLALAAAPKTK